MTKIVDVILLSGYPAVYHPKSKTVVISDLHFGYEENLANQGLMTPRRQLEKALELLHDLYEITRAEKIIINGDIKESYDKLTLQERREIIDFLTEAKKIFSDKIVFIKGNHDNNRNLIKMLKEQFRIRVTDKYRLSKNTLVTHGHKLINNIAKYKLIIIGHEHPALNIKDELGFLFKVPCFLKIPTTIGNTILVLPPSGYYQLQSGYDISKNKENYLSPIIRKYGITEKAIPFALETNEKSLFEFPPLEKIIFINKTKKVEHHVPEKNIVKKEKSL